MTVPTLDQRAFAFVASGDIDEDTIAMSRHDRWTAILTKFPRLSRRRIYHDCTDVYQEAYKDGRYQTLFAAHDLAMMQARFYSYLMVVGGGFRHILQWNLSNIIMWRDKLNDCLETVSPDLSEKELDDLEARLSAGEEVDGAELIEIDEDEVVVMTTPDPRKRLTEPTRHQWVH